MSRYLMATSSTMEAYIDDIAAEMTELAGISISEAIARINHFWDGQDMSNDDDLGNGLVYHELPHYWAMAILYTEVKSWSPDADRSDWALRPAPEAGSRYWTSEG
ncbi:hypothetical protein GT755_00245 [Herbidospora sp. NEAU-GS84]|uniref:Uncharacterized protein n=1 Tax=Herbidospora solisilvae TaxID=2696284 RepID=A0A7C9MY42_9ACTN|nr:hypothetical protein [Herbidospora solisilvae]NAS20109.1 hypothetical protein [Herbidospora solisilvae]